jgi:RNase H-fold protein (predicted Holliday junction resolvase)
MNVISVMMSLDQAKRPNVEDLMTHPKIAKVIREVQFKEIVSGIKKKEGELLKREEEYKKREERLLEEENAIKERE